MAFRQVGTCTSCEQQQVVAAGKWFAYNVEWGEDVVCLTIIACMSLCLGCAVGRAMHISKFFCMCNDEAKFLITC